MSQAREISQALAIRVSALAPHLLPNGKRAGNYWQAGDVYGNSGSSLYLNLVGEWKGHWRDAATHEHGDLLDLIAIQQNISLAEAIAVARELIGDHNLSRTTLPSENDTSERDKIKSANALWARTISLTTPQAVHGRTYLEARGLSVVELSDLRFMPSAWVWENDTKHSLPALVGAVRKNQQELIAVHRIFLHPSEPRHADLEEPKRALAPLTGGACWLRPHESCLIIAEGIETAISVGMAFPAAALAAGITGYHMSMMEVPTCYQQIMIAADNDEAGLIAAESFTKRMTERKVITVLPRLKDFNDDLQADGLEVLKANIKRQIP